ncbi:steroidogenic acute regulatory protein-like [Nasonia vitripennis]|uniref:MENTAL domain-containing protein n=1 Tax=Nasonia vitripennis TaxID=7425 RepID=A0A7M7QNS4_NASVI|nr:steroidogenic acute regulatory protein-like [Nasonia vitripennis]
MFDFFFTFFMWLICAVTAHTIFQTTVVQEIINYTMETSLFDVVVIATCRFVILIAFYLVLRMDHWCVVALSTASTCAFLLAKIFLYNWSQSRQPVLQVLFIIVSFVLVWAEVCRLDIPLPHDIQAANSNSGLADSETTPLHYSYVQVSILPRENVSYYYTPTVSPNQSDEEEVDHIENSRVRSLPISIAKRIPYDPFLYMNN